MKTKFFQTKQSIALGLVLSASATLMSGAALAVDAVGGSAANNDIVVPSAANWTILRTVTFQNPGQRYCTATGSADARNPVLIPSAAPWQYRFTVSNNPNPPLDQGQERTLEFWNQAIGGGFLLRDNLVKEVTTTGGWMNNVMADPGYFTFPAVISPFQGHTVYFLARKFAPNSPNLTVTDNSLTVTCTDNRLVRPINIIPIPLSAQ